MALFYRSPDRDQLMLMPISMHDWLEEGHLAYFMIDVVGRLDTALLHARHPNDGVGRPAYDPDMMLTVLLYAYASGVRSARRIEAACRTDAAYRVICGGLIPDHTTFARFTVDHQDAMASLFTSGLRLCAAAGLIDLSTVAIDGTKIGANAALGANRDADWIRAQVTALLADAIDTDAAQGDSPVLLPAGPEGELMTLTGRAARLTAALAVIEAQDQADKCLAAKAAQTANEAANAGRRLRGRKPTNPIAALARAEADYRAAVVRWEINQAARERKIADTATPPATPPATAAAPVPGRAPVPDSSVGRAAAALTTARAAAALANRRAHQANTTDPDSRIMKTARTWLQGYNAQVVVDGHQIVLAATVTQHGNDVELYQPLISALTKSLSAAEINTPVGVALADAGYWSEDNATAPGPDRLIATQKDWKQRRAARQGATTNGAPPSDASPQEKMEHRLRTPEGTVAYSRRCHLVEPVFGNIKENRTWRRFRRRGLPAVNSEWQLMNLSHNLAKIAEHQALKNTENAEAQLAPTPA